MTGLQRAAARITNGSQHIAGRLLDRIRTWISRGRRDDLTGWAAAVGCWLRLALLLGLLAALARTVRAAPNLMWLLTTVWLVAAWRTGRTAEEQHEDTPEQAPTDALLDLLHTLIADARGVHLATLLQHLQQHGQWEGRTISDLRAALDALGVPVRRSLKAGGRVAVGVHRDDLPTPSPTPAAEQAA